MITGNKGEWSEVYTLLKVIADKQLFAGDSNPDKTGSLVFPIVKVLRDESNGAFEFGYENDWVIIKNNTQAFRIPVARFREQAGFLLTKLKEKTSATFSIPETEAFINSFNSHSLKARSSVKSDIRIVIHDQRTGTNPELGFSIKSRLGRASTLLNAGRTTNFIYKIKSSSFSNQDAEYVNSLFVKREKKLSGDIKGRIRAIVERNGALQFEKMESSMFENNLVLIDSALPGIVSEILLLSYTSNHFKIADLVAEISARNPLGYHLENNHPFYSYKIKRFLTDIALGMMPSKVWTGELEATGGYLVVQEDGTVLCYHIYNRNGFEDYLFANTRTETVSSSRHGFGAAYEENGQFYFKLNLQVRFL